ncbi:MAG: YgfZ/GcvT domain-containing protein, partial [Terriglobales bacterium]
SQVQKLLGIFDHYIIMDDVEITDLSGKLCAVGIAGPKANDALRSAGLDFPPLQPLSTADVTWRDVPLAVVRCDAPSIESYEIWVSSENKSSLQDALEKSGARRVGTTALNLLRIAQGIPRFGMDIRERDLPQETGQQRALHFTKGCYIGQEIVERIRSRGNVHRMFTGFTVEGALPEPGTKINVGGKEVGEITSAASLPLRTGDYSVALGYLRREAAIPGKPIQLENSVLTIANLPFSEVFKR